jgi:mono/diheme cytochrome c family protein
MTRRLLASLALISLAAAFARGQASQGPAMSRGWTFDEQGGAAIYASVCAGCHQPNAEGASGAADYPALAANANIASANSMVAILLFGQRGMPPVGRMMSDEQAADVINYVRSHFGNTYDAAVSAADVRAARSQIKSAP